MKIGIIKVNLYTFNELSDRVKKQVRITFGPFFKEHINENTLFLSSGKLYEKNSLNFIGLKCNELEVEENEKSI